ncbi:MAG: PD-(D/E)XK nuclease family transposase, partial [Acholeplasmatales bacterium]|nr:PD-(D/E)XK nuclease family transposase [Acholeplasmatales bacterium]
MYKILKYPPSHPVMFNGIFDDSEILAEFLNSTELFDIKDHTELKFLKQSFESGVRCLTPIMDLRVIIGDYKHLNLEMQNKKPLKYDLCYRLCYYLSKLMGKTQEKGENYTPKECIVFAVLN